MSDETVKLEETSSQLTEEQILESQQNVCKAALDSTMILKQPIMYFYNFTGVNQQITIDFANLKIQEAYPEIRKDNKVILNIGTDNFVDNKYDYFYYEIELEKKLSKPETILYLNNDKTLGNTLRNLADFLGLWSPETDTFIHYTNFELKKFDNKVWKVELFTEETLNSQVPINIFPEPDFFIRRYVRFTPYEKGSKSTKSIQNIISKPKRLGGIRIIEYGIIINTDIIK